MKYINIDKYLKEHIGFWEDLETICFSECCGLGAYDFSIEHLDKTIVNYNSLEITSSLKRLKIYLEKHSKNLIESNILNHVEDKNKFIKRINKLIKYLKRK